MPGRDCYGCRGRSEELVINHITCGKIMNVENDHAVRSRVTLKTREDIPVESKVVVRCELENARDPVGA